MSIGELYSSSVWSTLKYTGSAIVSRFYTTLANQELILFLDKEGKQIRVNSLTVESESVDVYLTIVRNFDNPSAFVYTDEPVLVVKAGETLNITGVEILGIKLSNALGTKLFCMASKY